MSSNSFDTVYLLFCYKVNDHFLKQGLEKASYNVDIVGVNEIKPNSIIDKFRLYLSYILLSFKISLKSKKNDLIISRQDFLAVLCFWFCKLLFKKRRIIGINIMLKDRAGISGRIERYLYKKALIDSNFVSTVTTIQTGEYINSLLKTTIKFNLLPDDYGGLSSFESEFHDMGNRVFCGGYNGRNWNLLFEIAQKMNNVHYDVVMSKHDFDKGGYNVPENVKVYFNIPNKDFFDTMDKCSIVFLPLNTNSPAGLIVVLAAALKRKLIIITKTPATLAYIDHLDSGILIDKELKSDQIVNTISYYLNELEIRKVIVENEYLKIKEMASPEAYLKKLVALIESF